MEAIIMGHNESCMQGIPGCHLPWYMPAVTPWKTLLLQQLPLALMVFLALLVRTQLAVANASTSSCLRAHQLEQKWLQQLHQMQVAIEPAQML